MSDYTDNGITIEELKDRIDIVDVIGSVVNLKKTGANHKGLCPFHSEKTPSFIVSEQRQTYHCFGCGEGGDVISFVEKYYNLDFLGAAEKLADSIGAKLKKTGRRDESSDRLLEMNRKAAIFFYKAMRSGPNPGLSYMAGRGMDAQTMRDFGIGWADGEWTSLHDHLASLGYKDEEMLEVGLVSKADSGRIYDRFRSRVIFPIMNTSGKVIGFGGRIVGDGEPKYLNSQESTVFKKKYNLYGLNVTRQYIQKEKRAILVEGYMDVVSLYQAGVRCVSASLGTALTENQANMLRRYTKNVVLSYDADEAGQNATARGMDILKDAGCDVGIVIVSDGKDPDEFIKKRGKEAYMDLVRSALSFADYKFMRAKEKYDMGSTSGRLGFLREAVAILKELSPVEADMYIKQLSRENDISEGAIRAEMERAEKPEKETKRRGDVRSQELTSDERKLLRVLLTKANYVEHEKEFQNVFKTDAAAGIFKAVKQVYEPDNEIDTDKLMDVLEEEEQNTVRRLLDDEMLSGDVDDMYRSLIKGAETKRFKEREDELLTLLSMAENVEDPEKIREMMQELREIQRELSVRRN
ncbi:MAG: DNA primase [Firmicutes bacterium]|nr:DNA primase [Bacillota bacterium]